MRPTDRATSTKWMASTAPKIAPSVIAKARARKSFPGTGDSLQKNADSDCNLCNTVITFIHHKGVYGLKINKQMGWTGSVRHSRIVCPARPGHDSWHDHRRAERRDRRSQ